MVRGRTPCGVRGLKLLIMIAFNNASESHPVWGAWIETIALARSAAAVVVAPRVGCVD